MTAACDDLRQLMERREMSSRTLAPLLDVDDRLVRRWLAGKIPVPAEVLEWLRALDAVYGWRPEPRPEWFRSLKAEVADPVHATARR